MVTNETIERIRAEQKLRNQSAAQARRMIKRGAIEPSDWMNVQATPAAIAMAIEGMDTDTIAAFIHDLLFSGSRTDDRDPDEAYDDGLADGKEMAKVTRQGEPDSPTARMLRQRYGTTKPASVRDFFVGGA
jgi:hypothetical protein